MKNICPVCGWDGLEAPAYDDGEESYEICLSCGFQFGVTDDDDGFTFEQWRSEWVAEGMIWNDGDPDVPEGWNPVEQLRNIGK